MRHLWGWSGEDDTDIPAEKFTSESSKAHKQGRSDLLLNQPLSEGKVALTVRFRSALKHWKADGFQTSDSTADIYPGQLVRGVLPSFSLLHRVQDLGGGDVPFGLCGSRRTDVISWTRFESTLRALQPRLTCRSGPLQSGLSVAAELSICSLHVCPSLMEDRGGTSEERRTTRKAGNYLESARCFY